MSNFINVDKLYYAIMTGTDLVSGLPSYGTPKVLTSAAKVNVDPTTNKVPYYADGVVQETCQVTADGKISIQGATLTLAVQADLFGHVLDGLGGLIYNKNDVAPYVCIFYRRQKANNKFRYVKIYKCVFSDSKDAAETATNTVKPQDEALEGVFFSRIADNNWKKVIDDETVGYTDVSSTFFTQVDGAVDLVVPVVSSTTPAANATAVAISSAYAWVFSKSLNPSTITLDNFRIVNDTTGTPVVGIVAYVDATKTVTFTPSTNLTTATKYAAIADTGVLDIPGNKLVYTHKFFTTA